MKRERYVSTRTEGCSMKVECSAQDIKDSEKQYEDELPANLDIRQMRDIVSLVEGLNRNIPFQQTLDYVFNAFQMYIPYTHIGVALLDGKIVRATFAASSPKHRSLAQKLMGYATDIRITSLNNVIKTGNARMINDLEVYAAGKPLRPYNRILLEAGIKSSITFPLLRNGTAVGILFFSSDRKNVYTGEHIRFLKILAGNLLLALERGILLENMVISSSLALAALAEKRDTETGEHLTRIKHYCRFLAELLYKNKKFQSILDFKFIGDLERFSPLHDIGKVAIRDNILLKPGPLTKEEYKIMQTHTVYGAKVLRTADENLKHMGRSIYQMGIEIAEGHHEKWDGSGYPFGLEGEKIPLSARIVAISDVFDALTSPRVYKPAFTFEDAFVMMCKESQTHFDPVIFDIFEKNKEAVYKLYNELREDKQP